MVYVFRMVRKAVLLTIFCWVFMFSAVYKSKQRHSKTGRHTFDNYPPTPPNKRSYNALKPVVVRSNAKRDSIPYKRAIRSPYIGLGVGQIYKSDGSDRALLKKRAREAFAEKRLRESPAVDMDTDKGDSNEIRRVDGIDSYDTIGKQEISQHSKETEEHSDKNERPDAEVKEVWDSKVEQKVDTDDQGGPDRETHKEVQGRRQGQRDWKLTVEKPTTFLELLGADSERTERRKEKVLKKNNIKKKKTKRADFILIDPRFELNLDRKRDKLEFSIEPNIIDEITCDDNITQRCYHDIGVNFTVVTFIPISPSAKARRQLLRETVASVTYADGARYVTLFVVGNASESADNRAIEEESGEFGDILRYDRPDSYINLPLKTLAILQWSAENLPSHFLIIKMDDDVARSHVRVTQLVGDVIRKRSAATNSTDVSEVLRNFPIICGNSIFEGAYASRDSANKWFIGRNSYSMNRWPRACAGPMYLLSARTAAKLYEVSRNTAMIPLEDMWVTGVLRIKLGEGDTNIMASGYSNAKIFGIHVASSIKASHLPELRLRAAHSFQMQAMDVLMTCLCVRKLTTNGSVDKMTPLTIRVRLNKLV